MRRLQRVSSLSIVRTKELSSDLTGTKPHYGGKSDSFWLPLNSCDGIRFFDLPIPLIANVTVSTMVKCYALQHLRVAPRSRGGPGIASPLPAIGIAEISAGLCHN